MFSILDSLVSQADVISGGEAIDALDWVFASESATSTDRTASLYEAVRTARSETQWRVISAYLKTDFRLIGRPGMMDRLLFERCDMEVLRDLLHSEDGILAEMVKMTAGVECVTSASVRVVHLAFDGLLAISRRSGLESDKVRIEQFILAVQKIFRDKNSARVPSSVWVKFKAFREENEEQQ